MKDNKPSVIVVRTTSGYIFGGGISIQWEKSSGEKKDPSAFTFSTTHHKVCKVKKDSTAVNFVTDNFMEFGATEFKFDKSDQKITQGTAAADHNFDCGAENKHTFYNNGEFMTINDLFAYHVTLTKIP